ncbi:MAG: exodeoxyribonuclease VII large subunit [bacterium]
MSHSLFGGQAEPGRGGKPTGDAAAGGAAGSGAKPGRPKPLGVAQVATLIDQALRKGLPLSISVVGEVSNFTDRQHWYFAIKEAEASLPCVMFASRARASPRPLNGQQVVVTGRVEFYTPRGQITFYVERIEPVGTGALEEQLRRLVEECRTLGWLDPERKRPLPMFPRRVAVVTSRTGAALQDVLSTMAKRCPAVDVVLVDALVQGAEAAPSVVAAIGRVASVHERLGIDALIVTRGGGSMEDLWAFNDKAVAEAIVMCPIPVAAAIGHETDTTLAELVADERCATPTQAAMQLTPDRAALGEQQTVAAQRLVGAIRRTLGEQRSKVEQLGKASGTSVRGWLMSQGRAIGQLETRLQRHRPVQVYSARRTVLARLEHELAASMQSRLRACRHSLDAAAATIATAVRHGLAARRQAMVSAGKQLELVGPLAVLRRGFSVTTDAEGRVVASVAQVQTGQALTTRLADGKVTSVVTGGLTAALGKPRMVRRRSSSEGEAGPGLFGG